MSETEPVTIQDEHQYHQYAGKKIPWFVHLLWVLFWCFAIYYALRFALPSIGPELLAPP